MILFLAVVSAAIIIMFLLWVTFRGHTCLNCFSELSMFHYDYCRACDLEIRNREIDRVLKPLLEWHDSQRYTETARPYPGRTYDEIPRITWPSPWPQLEIRDEQGLGLHKQSFNAFKEILRKEANYDGNTRRRFRAAAKTFRESGEHRGPHSGG